MSSLWSFRALRPWLFRRWERRRRASLARAPSSKRPLSPGDLAPPFVLRDDRGHVRRSAEWIGGRKTAVWFTNLCAICADQAAELEALFRTGEIDATLVAIHLPGPSAPPPAEFRRRTGATFPILIDDGAVGTAWAGEAVPDT